MKYIFIDSNQYRHIFSLSEGFSDSVHDLLIRLIDSNHAKLLLPQQTREEVERNRYRQWPENEIKNIESKITNLKDLLEKREKDLGSFKVYKDLVEEVNSEINKLEKEKEKIISTFTNNRSKANQKLKKLFGKAVTIDETSKIRQLADIRFKKKNPPYGDNVGDSLIWESLLSFFENIRTVYLIFVANDKQAWGKYGFDRILQDKFKKQITGRRIKYINKLSDIPEITVEEQEKIKAEEQDNSKRNAVIDFVNSQSFIDAGEKANKLLLFKNLLTTDDYQDILRASLSNHEIYQSFFTAIPLSKLVIGDDDYVIKEIESIDAELWNRFAKKYEVSLKRQSDQQNEAKEDEDDIPF
ncbi:MAG: hypothetical protein A2785_04390 [Candidatus Chisholmbacteria bacterium RIFCSPHIGHO2_01_FULL_49_18]|uniref:DUF4935 domain-containing protein n=2 Tax=Candidatus Chisholmiibacteriota TaxID=1817900 RepID=A0A1G1VPA1_9BACT|nr:MAG: hypothetical protein A2785_04390 [Candidatus Chisholmbacteria bacterium RIFCSPHIGHO2_01_FULL_49_18]OGY22563.1 MAG: hypothetical protein A3A65_01055 [Candidatus Chisholmbacteria bacterium RIFCSPLOWO2_01_FULL_49_14]